MQKVGVKRWDVMSGFNDAGTISTLAYGPPVGGGKNDQLRPRGTWGPYTLIVD